MTEDTIGKDARYLAGLVTGLRTARAAAEAVCNPHRADVGRLVEVVDNMALEAGHRLGAETIETLDSLGYVEAVRWTGDPPEEVELDPAMLERVDELVEGSGWGYLNRSEVVSEAVRRLLREREGDG